VSDPATESARFIPGTIIDGRYRIVGLLGRGGMGEVYRADDLKLGQPVALKFLPSDVAQDGARLERFLNEVRSALKVTHTNVCRVHDIGEVDGQHYLSMEYVDGEDLGSLLRRIGRLPRDKAVQIARQLCAGLEAAHEQGILHRDLKPANVMIDGRGRAKITDFGLAGLAETIVGDEIRVGTPLYMAPEQSAGEEVSVRSDIYSLGLVLYELFTGRRAFEAETAADLDRLRDESTPTTPSSHVQDLDPAVERTILRCLETEPEARPSSALAVAAALPGGDPLAAALAAGETPSPEMVADAGEVGGLRPVIGVPLLAFVIVGLVAIAGFRDRYSMEGIVPLPKPTEALAVEAREILESGGITIDAADSEYRFAYDYEYLEYLEAQEPTISEWENLSAGHPAPIHFWYRQSPEHLVASDFFSDDEYQFISPSDPPWTVEGMAGVWLDPQGRLIRLKVVPPPFATTSSVADPVDWTPLFEAAGYDITHFTVTAPRRNPLVSCDERLAWEGVGPDAGSIRIEACSNAGVPAHFEVVPEWRWDSSGSSQSSSSLADAIFFSTLLFAVVVGGAVLARRNLRLGRGDRRGALRVAAYVFGVLALAWVLQAPHVPSFAEIGLFFNFLAYGLMVAVLVWMVYVALEPYARRLWPEGLISWSRLLAGRIRDPLVGRDILIGAAAGVFTQCWWGFYRWLLEWLALPAELPRTAALISLSGTADAIGSICQVFAISLYMPVGWLLILLLLRVLFRRQWIAIVVVVLFAAGLAVPSAANPIVFFTFMSVAFGMFLFVLLRFGLLAPVFWGIYMWLASAVVLTLDSSAWYAGRSWFTLLLFAALAAYGFWISLAGRPLMKAHVLEGE
jgi:serine/threonine-protein kinase